MVVLLPCLGTAWLDGQVGSGWVQGAVTALLRVPDALFGYVPVQLFLQSNELPLKLDVDKDVLQLCVSRGWALDSELVQICLGQRGAGMVVQSVGHRR